ncbi:hypothetical protein VMCG_10696 [Cytospora schulzeri]|uniref:Uncharacterized protein n=1 Tax=Cytospora schulzeri TaxID=448051 RepID=A0A423V921_9PEZI|nr:hypothetical protein VMCG_10696 [Valsa malicola]
MSDGANFTMFPLWGNMNFTQNCTLYGNWLSTFVQDSPWDPGMTLDGSAWLIVRYFESALPDNYTFPGDGTWGKYYGTILDCNYVDKNETGIWMTDQFYDNVLMGPSEPCRPQYCMALGFTGNMDLTGIGVFVAYYAEAILATIYLVAFTLGYTRRHLPDSRQHPHSTPETQLSPEIYHTKGKGLHLGRRAMNAFRGSLNVFLNTSMLFSLVMLSAALYISARRTVEHKSWLQSSQPIPSGSALYDLVLSLLASTFSVFPVTMLYAIQRRRDVKGALRTGDHQVWIRRAVLAILWCLTAAEVYISPRGEYDYEERYNYNEEKVLVYLNCEQRGGMPYWHGMIAAQALVIGAPLLWLVLTLFVLTGFRIPGVVDRPWVSRWRAKWRLVVAWVNVLFMWGLLAYFTVLRHRINVTAGHLDSEDQWTFGQILALATWAPVVFEFAYIFIWGIKEGLERNLPSGFIVKQVPPDTPTPPTPDLGGLASDNSHKAKEPLMSIQSVPMYSPPLMPPDATTTVELTGPPRTHTYTTLAGDPAQVYTAYEPQYYQSPQLNYYRPQQQVWNTWQSSGW